MYNNYDIIPESCSSRLRVRFYRDCLGPQLDTPIIKEDDKAKKYINNSSRDNNRRDASLYIFNWGEPKRAPH